MPIALILLVLQLLPGLLSAIQSVEAAIAASKAGAQKKAVVMAAAVPAGTDPAVSNHISGLVDAHVAAMNATKLFKHSD